MQLLPVTAPLDGFHHQIFCGNEGKVFLYSLFYNFLIDMQTVCYILGKPQHRIGTEESLRH